MFTPSQHIYRTTQQQPLVNLIPNLFKRVLRTQLLSSHRGLGKSGRIGRAESGVHFIGRPTPLSQCFEIGIDPIREPALDSIAVQGGGFGSLLISHANGVLLTRLLSLVKFIESSRLPPSDRTCTRNVSSSIPTSQTIASSYTN